MVRHMDEAATYESTSHGGGSGAGGVAGDDARGAFVGHGLHEHLRAQGQPGEVGERAHGRLHLRAVQARRRRLHAGCRRRHRRNRGILQSALSQTGTLFMFAD